MSAAEPAPPQRLPAELIWHIIEKLLPPNVLAIQPPSSSATKTLLSFTLVSRSTYRIATRLLQQRCMHIDSSRRLSSLLLALSAPLPTSLPRVPALKCVTTLYLSPIGKSLDDKPTALWIRELFCEVHDTLRRLVIDFPWQSLDPVGDDHLDVWPTRRDGLNRLHRLEELVILRELPLAAQHNPAVSSILHLPPPFLRRIVLFNAPVDQPVFWDGLFDYELDVAILVRPVGLEIANIKGIVSTFSVPLQPLRIVLADVENEMPEVITGGWSEYDPTGKVRAEKYFIPTSFYGDDETDTVCRDWVKGAALRGSIWEWECQPVEPVPIA